MNINKPILLTIILLLLAESVFAGRTCDNVDGEIASSMQEANKDFKKANKLAASIADKGTMQAVRDVAGVLNPIPSVQSALEDGFWSVCGKAIGSTVTAGIQATKTALEISMAIGSNETSFIQGQISSLRLTGQEHLGDARRALQWKKENCRCEDESMNAETTPPEQEESSGVTTGSGQTISGGGITVRVLGPDSVEVSSNCNSKDKRIQMRSTGTWSTKATKHNSVVIDGLKPGVQYTFRQRCQRQNGDSLLFELPQGR